MKRFEVDEFYPKKLFFRRHEFMGTLSMGVKSVTDLHIVLQYSLIKEGEIVAKVLGNTDMVKNLMSVVQSSGSTLKLSTKATESSRISFNADNVLLGTVINKPMYQTQMSYQIADLKLWDLTIKESISSAARSGHLGGQGNRTATFFLTGPTTLWETYEILERSFTGEEKIEVRNSKIELNEQTPFEIETRPFYLYENTASEEHVDLKTRVQVLIFKTSMPISQLSDSEFISLAESTADDLTLLVSFISRRWVTWFRYELMTAGEAVAFIRNARECSSKEVEYNESSIPFNKARAFLKTGYTELQNLRKSHINLNMPLVYFVSANEAKYMEERFSTFFLSLERIKDMFSRGAGLQKIYKTGVFKKLSSAIRGTVKQELGESPQAEMLLHKIPELNRPSLRAVLDLLFDRYEVKWNDLYPPGSEFTLIKTRDVLFHSSQEIDMDNLMKEELRLQSLLERLLLSMLGWKDFSFSPINYKRGWLQEQKRNQT